LISTELCLSSPPPPPPPPASWYVKRVKIFAPEVTPDIVSIIMVFLTPIRYVIYMRNMFTNGTMPAVCFGEINKAERDA